MSPNPVKPQAVAGNLADPKAMAQAILAKAQSSRTVIQDFVPLADSIEWNLGQEYLRQRGNKAFLSDSAPVPYIVNNDGTLSANAAAVLFANLLDAELAGTLPAELFVLELGVGVGLFARYFLDAFRELCDAHRKDFYDRLCYIAADRSARMLLDVCRHGVLAEHAGRYVLRLVDAMKPEMLLRDVMLRTAGGKPLRAVFLNYLLDCLPAAVLEVPAGDKPAGFEDSSRGLGVGEKPADKPAGVKPAGFEDSSRGLGVGGLGVTGLHVRTCLARNIRLEDYTDLTADVLAERARANDAEAQRELLEVYHLFASEYAYLPVDVKALPLGEFALEFARKKTKRLLHSYGAIQSLDRLLALVDDGFILANDYGSTKVTGGDEFEHQRFSLATFVGVNFSLLAAYFGSGRCQYVEPYGDSASIHSRLLGHKLSYNTKLRFQERFSQAGAEQLQAPLVKARECSRARRDELAYSYYQEAQAKQPGNWVLLGEMAQFLIFLYRDVQAGINLAKVALALNPTCSSELWNILGDGLFEFGRYAEAGSAYRKALEVNESDVRGRYNLAYVYQREKNFPAALQIIAEAITLDRTGQYRDRLLQKQSEVVAQQAQRHQQEYLLLVNLVSKYSPAGTGEKAKDE